MATGSGSTPTMTARQRRRWRRARLEHRHPRRDGAAFLDANGDGQHHRRRQQNWIAQQTDRRQRLYLFTAQTHSGGMALGSPVPLYPGQYIVGIAPTNFVPGGPLAGYYSSGTTISNAGVISEVAAPDPNNEHRPRRQRRHRAHADGLLQRRRDRQAGLYGLQRADWRAGKRRQLPPARLPIADNRSNLTLDFGFYTTSLGNLVWVDDGAGGGTLSTACATAPSRPARCERAPVQPGQHDRDPCRP